MESIRNRNIQIDNIEKKYPAIFAISWNLNLLSADV